MSWLDGVGGVGGEVDMNYLDLFSGIGGFALGAHRAGLIFDKHYFSEIDKHAKKIYQKHFPTAIDLGGVQNIGEGLGKIDFVTFGFPCQDLSVAGKRAGLAGSRSSLFFEATRLIRFYKPTTFIFENVAGLLSNNEGKDFEVVLREIADIGLYECEWQLLNTSWFLPQNRERVYFIGHLGKGCGQKVFPVGESAQESEGELGGAVPALQARDYKGIGNQKQGLVEVCAMRGRNPNNPSDRTTGSPTEQRIEINKNGTTNTLTSVSKDNLVICPK